jgi:hypothetical protein
MGSEEHLQLLGVDPAEAQETPQQQLCINPSLESYRVSASKLFTNIPYFPVAFIPRLTSDDARCRSILDRQMDGDWTDDPEALAKFGEPFGARVRELYKRASR